MKRDVNRSERTRGNSGGCTAGEHVQGSGEAGETRYPGNSTRASGACRAGE